MIKLRLLVAVWITKILTFFGRLMGRNASSTPGKIALKICPNLIRVLSGSVKSGIIAVCGTNGKTTTNNLLYSALTQSGYRVICNTLGANMLSGIAVVFAQSCNIFGKLTADYACLEIDEAYATALFDHITPSHMLITNLFRDQLDRYGEIDITAGLLKNAINKAGNIQLILNGDDPLTAQFGLARNNTRYFGVTEQVLPQVRETRESRFCVLCGAEMQYSYYHYSQLGDFRCPQCGYSRPHIDFAACGVDMSDSLNFTVNSDTVRLKYRGFYNIYNTLAVYAVLSVLGVPTAHLMNALAQHKPQVGRMEEFAFRKPVIFNLSKNPAGFNQAIMTLQNDIRKKDVIVAINDNPADGTDISWLWDVDFDKLGCGNLHSLTVTGTRLYDIALRFKYANVAVDYITTDIRQSVINSLNSDSKICYILVNYTALFSTHDLLSELLRKGGELYE